ncbi:Ras GTPase-activating protein 1 [Coemansia sp. S100]|nr:Ras GTPase-activating protein 1 [Coemansia sp. S100]
MKTGYLRFIDRRLEHSTWETAFCIVTDSGVFARVPKDGSPPVLLVSLSDCGCRLGSTPSCSQVVIEIYDASSGIVLVHLQAAPGAETEAWLLELRRWSHEYRPFPSLAGSGPTLVVPDGATYSRRGAYRADKTACCPWQQQRHPKQWHLGDENSTNTATLLFSAQSHKPPLLVQALILQSIRPSIRLLAAICDRPCVETGQTGLTDIPLLLSTSQIQNIVEIMPQRLPSDPDVRILTTGVLYVRVHKNCGARRLVPHALAPGAEWQPHIAVLSECAGYVSLLLYDVDGALVAEIAEIEVCGLLVYDIQPDDESLFGNSFGFHIDLSSAPLHSASFHKRPDSAQSAVNSLSSKSPAVARSGRRGNNCQSVIVDGRKQTSGKASAIRARQRSKSLSYAASLGYQNTSDTADSHNSQAMADGVQATSNSPSCTSTPPVVYFAAMQAGERNNWIAWLRMYAVKPYSDPIPQPLGFTTHIPLTSRVERCLWINICEIHGPPQTSNVASMLVVNGHPLAQSSVVPDPSQARLSSSAFFFGGLSPIQHSVCILVCNMDSEDRTPISLLGYSQVPVPSLCRGSTYDGWFPLLYGDIPTSDMHLGAYLPLADNVTPAPRRTTIKPTDTCKSPGRTKQRKGASPIAGEQDRIEPHCGATDILAPPSMPFRSGDVHMQLWYEELVILAPPFYASVVAVLFEEHPTLITDLVAIAPKSTDWLVETMAKIALSNNHAVSWIVEIVRHELEVQAVHDPALVFRGASIATRAVDALMKVTGLSFVDHMIGDIVRDVVNNNYKCEVDPAKLQPGECIEEHWQTLAHLLEALWEGIESGVSCCPPIMRQTFAGIRRAASAFYSEHGAFEQVRYSCISGFIFLRLLCPAMLAPKSFGLVGRHPCASSLRVLTLMAKGIQCTANLTDFALKEPYMQPMNMFVQRCTPKLKRFIDDIANDTAASSSGGVDASDSEATNGQPSGGSSGTELLVIDRERELAALCALVSSSSAAIQTAIASGKHQHVVETCPASPTAVTTYPSVPRQPSISSSTNTLLGGDGSPSKLAVDTYGIAKHKVAAAVESAALANREEQTETSAAATDISPTGTAVELLPVADSTRALQKLLHVCGIVQSCVNACKEYAEEPIIESPHSPTESLPWQ